MVEQRMSGRVCVVTGATAGMGTATASALARMGATVILVARSADRARRTRDDIVRVAEHDRVETVIADLAVQAQVRAAAAEILARHPAIHVLVNNAAVYTKKREETAEGMEMQLAVNHLAPFLLTTLLMPALRAGAPARVVTVSSGAHRGAKLNFDDPQMRNGYNGLRAYANTKLYNLLFTRELARRVPPAQVTANTLHPGVVATALLLGGWGPLRFFKRFMRTPEQGASTIIHLASSPEVATVTGEYFQDEKIAPTSALTWDAAAARRLWDLSAELTGISPTATL